MDKLLRPLLALTALALLMGAGAAAGSPAAVRPGAAAAAPGPAVAGQVPGTDPAIQRWFKANEGARISFNDTLLKAERDIATHAGTASCAALSRATKVLTVQLSALSKISNGGAAIAAAYNPPIAQLADVASACVAGDFTSAQAQLGSTDSGAVAAYGDAQAAVDEILDGGA